MGRLTRYRPTKTTDAGGGFTTSLGAGVSIFGAIRVHRNAVQCSCREQTDLLIDDIIVADGAQYRVTERLANERTRAALFTLERVERPIDIHG